MGLKYRISTVAVAALLLALAVVRASFPENIEPLNKLKFRDVASKIFTGDNEGSLHQLRNIQLIKRSKVLGSEKVVIAAREKIFLIDPRKFSMSRTGNITYDSVIAWKSDARARELCVMKGQPDELCYNFISVVEALDQSGNRFLVCGTNSFDPVCRNYQATTTPGGRITFAQEVNGQTSGKQRCPFGPNQQSASLFTDGSLYSGTFQMFSGSAPVISRTMGDNPLRTSNSANTLNEPRFVSIIDGGDRVLVYFNELQEFPTGDKRFVPQVAQVCKNDVGGSRVLRGMWTTFLKSRLNCSYNGFYINDLRDVTKPVVINGKTVVFATFATPENSLAGSAVCSFTMDATKSALSGQFVTGEKLPSTLVTQPASTRHPGLCPKGRLHDSELRFVKSYPQMQKQALGSLLMTSQGVRHSAIAVDIFAGPYNVTVFYVGTDDGRLVRRLAPTRKMPRGAVVSDQDIFDPDRCSSTVPDPTDRKVLSLMVDNRRMSLTAAFKHCTITLPLRMCSIYKCRSKCIGSGDPYCGWNGKSCVSFDFPHQLGLEQSVARAVNEPELYPDCETQQAAVVPPIAATTTSANSIKPTTTTEQTTTIQSLALAGTGSQKMVPLSVLGIAMGLTFAFTVVLTILVMQYRKNNLCSSGQKEDKSDDFEKKQREMHRVAVEEQEKSLKRKARQTYRGCLAWLCQAPKSASQAPTPQVANKFDHRSSVSRAQNNYTEAPTLQKEKERAQKLRQSSSRQNSTCSSSGYVSQRKDSVFSRSSQRLSVHQPLLCNSISNESYEPVELRTGDTASVSFSQAPTLRYQSEKTSHSSKSSGGSSPSSSSGPVQQTSVDGAEVPQTASAKMRRRREQASLQTNEIMCDSDMAIRDFETTLRNMETVGCFNGDGRRLQIIHPVVRQRIDSDDSGKGESPRNSLRTDLEQPVSAITRQPRPNSLNLQRPLSNRRQRLMSEPADMMGAYMPHSVAFQRLHSIQQHTPTGPYGPIHSSASSSSGSSSRSQPSTPSGQPPSKLSLFQPVAQGPHQTIYGTLPKNDVAVPNGRRHRNHSGGMYPPMYAPRPAPSELTKQRRVIATRPSESPPRNPPNRYPSMQVRGPYANKTIAMHLPQPVVSTTPTKNHYPSLPHRSSSAPFGNPNVSKGNGFERPSSMHRRETLPSMMRQQSVPGVTPSKPMYVPTPSVPASISEQQPV